MLAVFARAARCLTRVRVVRRQAFVIPAINDPYDGNMLYSLLSNAYIKARAYIMPGATDLGAESEERDCDSPHLSDSMRLASSFRFDIGVLPHFTLASISVGLVGPLLGATM